MKISIVIPCHNAEPYIAQTLGSLLEQKRLPDEIIVVDDSSTDSSVEIVQRFYPHVRLEKKNFGLAAKTRNYGASIASGEAIMFLDADDLLDRNALKGLSEQLAQNPGGASIMKWHRLEKVADIWVRKRASVPRVPRGHDILSSWLTGTYYPPCCILWTRAAFTRIGGWNEVYCPNDDGDLVNRALVEGIPFQMAKTGAAYYRRIPDNNSLSGQRATARGLEARAEVIRKLAIWLEERQQLDAYRYAISYSIEEISKACTTDETQGVAATCQSLQKRFGQSTRARAIGNYKQTIRKNVGRLRCKFGSIGKDNRPVSNNHDTLKEVKVGHNAADKMLTAASNAAQANARHSPRDRPPKVSVVIPTYNRSNLVKRAMQSVLDQDYRDLELIVVDDASTDDTEEQVRSIVDHRIRYIRQSRNQDVSAARNRGMREARGEYIAFLDSDDEWLPNKLTLQVEKFEQLPPSYGALYTGTETKYEDGSIYHFNPRFKGDVLGKLLTENITDKGSASVIIRKNVIRVVGFFDEKIPAMEDYDYWIRIARYYKFDYIEQPLIRYHQDRRSDQRSLLRDADTGARHHLFRKFEPELKAHGITHQFLLTSANRRIKRVVPPDFAACLLSIRALAAKPIDLGSYKSFWRAIAPVPIQRFGSRTKAKLLG